MTVKSHIAELERRHAALDRRIEEAHRHPSMDGCEVTELKRHKLQIKDQISRLSADHARAAF